MAVVRTVDEQLLQVFTGLQPLPYLGVSLLEATGCFLAADVVTRSVLAPNEVVLPKGSLVTTRQLARLASHGISSVDIAPRPRVVVVSIGDDPQADSTTASQSNANSLVLASACREAGADVFRVGPIPREQRALRELVEDQLVRADVLLVVGGRGNDGYAELEGVLAEFGGVEYSQLAMAPGGVIGFGRIGVDAAPIVILPGETLGMYVEFEVFVRPLLRALAADPQPFRATVSARTSSSLESVLGLQEFKLGRIDVVDGDYVFTPSVMVEALSLLAESNALASVPPDFSVVDAGARVLVIPIEDPR